MLTVKNFIWKDNGVIRIEINNPKQTIHGSSWKCRKYGEMTLRIPDPNISDKILRLFGKKRALIIPKFRVERKEIDIYAVAVKENFWRALFRPRKSQLPAGSVDYENFKKDFDEIRN
jgi:hypothetical protein